MIVFDDFSFLILFDQTHPVDQPWVVCTSSEPYYIHIIRTGCCVHMLDYRRRSSELCIMRFRSVRRKQKESFLTKWRICIICSIVGSILILRGHKFKFEIKSSRLAKNALKGNTSVQRQYLKAKHLILGNKGNKSLNNYWRGVFQPNFKKKLLFGQIQRDSQLGMGLKVYAFGQEAHTLGLKNLKPEQNNDKRTFTVMNFEISV